MLRVARPHVRRYAERYCLSEAEDATQEALWTIHRKLPALRSVAAFPVWLLRIVARICFGLVTPLWRRIELLQDMDVAAAPADDPDLRLDLANAVEALPETCREAIVLFYYCDLSVAETAERLGISRSAAKVRLHRGRELLRVNLTRQEIEAGKWTSGPR